MIAIETLAAVFVETADTLVDDFDIIEFLELVTIRAAQISQADSAGLVLADAHGDLQFMAASQESAQIVELFAIQHDEGPCFDCYRSGAPVTCPDLSSASGRWPLFAGAALEAGFTASHAFPLRHRGSTFGALNLFSTGNRQFEPAELQIIQALGDVATIGILQERTIRAGEVLNTQLQFALTSRVIIEQAKGALARIQSVSVEEAFTTMRAYARANQHKLSDVARDLVTDPAAHPALTRSPR